ncbi:MAG TPA: hypothetical protein VM840_02585 [Actinomycetota bacterium]|nr:hypothetical protein [Actinomycetota bacterium]
MSAAVAFAIGSFSAAVVVSRVDVLTHRRVPWLLTATGVILLLSAYALVHLRHVLVPTTRATRAAAVALGAVGSFIIALCVLRYPAEVRAPGLALAARAAYGAVWLGCVVEPVIRFMWLARRRPPCRRRGCGRSGPRTRAS